MTTAGHSLLSVETAIAQIARGCAPLATESLPLVTNNKSESSLVGRVASADVFARLTHPPQDVSAMDGYAVKAKDTTSASPSTPSRLRLIGESAAGKPFSQSLTHGTCVRISTGGVMPKGADAIALLEDTETNANADANVNIIAIKTPASHRRFIRKRGQDFTEGDVVLTRGETITPRHMGLMAAAGITDINVHHRPRVTILTTGSELVSPGETPDTSKGQIISSNGVMLADMVMALGGVATSYGLVADDRHALQASIDEASRQADLLVITGGASVGKHDYVAEWMHQHATIAFWRIAMRPGKPMLFGHITGEKGSLPILGLPGNPVSAGVCTLIFGGAAIKAMLGVPPVTTPEYARLAKAIPHANDERQEYMRGRFASPAQDKHALWVAPLPSQDSGRLKDFAEAEALLIRPPYAPPAQEGDWVEIIRLDKV